MTNKMFLFTRKLSMQTIRFLQLSMLIALFSFSTSTFAIAYADGSDCSTNDAASCNHPNVVNIGGFDSAGLTVVGTRCTATMIQKPTAGSNKYVFLTAGHCIVEWSQDIVTTLGISFNPNLAGNGNIVDIASFVSGPKGVDFIPINNRNYKYNGISKFDYAVLVFTFNGPDPLLARWPSIATTPVATLPQDVNFTLDALLTTNPNPTFSAVGYGFVEMVNAPGTGGNQGGAQRDPASIGTKRFASTQGFINMTESILKVSQNPALGFNGTCYGDSGGPNYYTDPQLGEIVVGVTSGGDAVCRALGTNARLDIPEAVSFISCVRNATDKNSAIACQSSN